MKPDTGDSDNSLSRRPSCGWTVGNNSDNEEERMLEGTRCQVEDGSLTGIETINLTREILDPCPKN